MITDDDIDTALSDVLPLDESLPSYAGTWQEAPYADRDGRAVLALGDHSWDVLLDRDGGALLGLSESGDTFVLNGSLETFVRCVQAVVAAREEIERIELDEGLDDEDDLDLEEDEETEDEVEEVGERLAARLAEIDPLALDDDNQFWPVLADEL